MKTNILAKQADRTTSIAAVTTLTGRSGSLSPERIKMEKWLQGATRPHTTREISEATGINVKSVSHFMAHLVHQGLVRNMAEHTNRGSQYILASKIKKEGPAAPPRRSMMDQPTYVPPPMRPARPDAGDHEDIPSRRGQHRVSHMPMMLMASKVRHGEPGR